VDDDIDMHEGSKTIPLIVKDNLKWMRAWQAFEQYV
jgi:hypothetical protein